MQRTTHQSRTPTLLITALALLAFACSRPSEPEDAIRQVIDAIEHAVEAGDIGGLMQHLAEDYSDSNSNDKASLRGILFMQLQRSDGVSVTKRIDSITISEDASAAQSVVFTRLADGPMSSTSSRADVWRFDLQLRLEDDDWLVIRADQSQASLVQLVGGD